MAEIQIGEIHSGSFPYFLEGKDMFGKAVSIFG